MYLFQDLRSSGGATRTRPGGATRTRHHFHAALLASLAVLLARALMVYPTRVPTLPRRQASLSTRSHRSWNQSLAHFGTAAIVQSGRVHVSIATLASDGGSKLLVELLHSASLLLPSLLAVLIVMTASHAHVAAVLPANISHLSR